MARQRLDQVLVARGLVPSRTSAALAIDEGRVLVGGSVADKPSRQVSPSDPVEIIGPPPAFVSRGGTKLQGALDRFCLDVSGRSAVDAGSATGGFTDCLLQAGASRVLAVDVGYGQLHERLVGDDRVVSLERTNIRTMSRTRASELLQPAPSPSIVTGDLSFTSLVPLIEGLIEMAGPEGDVIVLCKPQFEVGRAVAARGKGVITDRHDRRGALAGVAGAIGTSSASIAGIMASPILGPAGNAEFLVHASARQPQPDATIEDMMDRALDEAELLG